MKGISTILAMILIVIIVVALIGLTYTFAANLFTLSTGAASNSTTSVTTNIQKAVYIVSGICKNTTPLIAATYTEWVNFTVQNSGTLTIGASELGATLDGGDISLTAVNYTSTPINAVPLAPGKIAIFGVSTTNNTPASTATSPGGTLVGTRTVTVSSPAGDVNYKISGC